MKKSKLINAIGGIIISATMAGCYNSGKDKSEYSQTTKDTSSSQSYSNFEKDTIKKNIQDSITKISTPTYSINFEKDTIWENNLAKARKENKLIFLDSYTQWCKPCKVMDKYVFTDKEVANFYNKNFINVKMDMETATGKKVGETYQVEAFPTLSIIKGDGKIVYKLTGGRDSEAFIKFGKKALSLEKAITEYNKKSSGKKSDGQEVYEYIQKIKESRANYSKTLEDYFKTQSEEEMVSRINWEIISIDESQGKIDSEYFKFLLENKEKFYAIYTKDSVDSEIENSYIESLIKTLNSKENNNSKSYETWKNKVEKADLDNSKEISTRGSMEYSWKTSNWDQYVKDVLLIDSLKGESSQNSDRINNAATRLYYEGEKNDKESIEKVAKWTEISIKLKESWANWNMHAIALYSLDKKEEAIEAEEKAIELIENSPYRENLKFMLSGLQKRLEKMKNGEEIR